MNKLYVLHFDDGKLNKTRAINDDNFMELYLLLREYPGFHYRTYSRHANKFYTIGLDNKDLLTDKLNFKLSLSGFRVKELKEMGYTFAHRFWLEALPIV